MIYSFFEFGELMFSDPIIIPSMSLFAAATLGERMLILLFEEFAQDDLLFRLLFLLTSLFL